MTEGLKADREFEQTVQWYPGHMAAAMRRIDDQMKLIDIVIEVVDSRVPQIGANPMLDIVAGRRPRLLVLSRDDLADPAQTARWLKFFESKRKKAVSVNAMEIGSVSKAGYFFGTSCRRIQIHAAGNGRRCAQLGKVLGDQLAAAP